MFYEGALEGWKSLYLYLTFLSLTKLFDQVRLSFNNLATIWFLKTNFSDLASEDDHGDDETDGGRDEDAAERREGDALRVVDDGAVAAKAAVPVLGRQHLKVTLLLQLKDDPGDVLLENIDP